MNWWHLYALVLLAGLVACLVTTPICRKLAEMIDLMDRPKKEAHKKHGKATPLLGGLALFLGWAGCLGVGYLVVVTGWGHAFSEALESYRDGFFAVGIRAFVLVGGAAGAMALGLVDDRYGMKAGTKFFWQFVIALMVVWLGEIRITLFVANAVFSWGVTIFWFMLLMNAINFFDNMDGLAVGTAAISFAFFAVTAGWQEQYFIAALSALSCGTAIGFWWYNRHPASIFMGDSGSLFLGYLLAAISASVTYYAPGKAATWLPVLLPLFILALPLFDAMAVVAIRTRMGKPFWIGDHNHISHRFMKMGMTRKQAVDCVHLLAVILGLSVWPLLWADELTAVVLVLQALFLLLLISLLQAHVKIDKK